MRGPPHRLRRLLPAALLAALLAQPASAGEPLPPIPPKNAVTALVRVLDMDQNLTIRGEGDVVVVVPYEKGQEAARDALLEVCQAVSKELPFRKRTVRWVPVQLKAPASPAAFQEALRKEQATAVLVPAGLSVPNLDAVAQASNQEKLHTLAMDATQVEKWFTMAVEPAEEKMQIVFNADNIRNAVGWFEVAILKVAKIYNADPERKSLLLPPEEAAQAHPPATPAKPAAQPHPPAAPAKPATQPHP